MNTVYINYRVIFVVTGFIRCLPVDQAEWNAKSKWNHERQNF